MRYYLQAIALSSIIIYLLYLITGFIIQRRIIFPRHLTEYDPESLALHADMELWDIQTQAGRTFAWFLPGYGYKTGRPKPAVIFAGGNADLPQAWAPLLRPYREAGINVIIPEYRGYGRSDGRPSKESIVTDFTDFYDLLAEHKSVDRGKIFFHGRSIGGGVVCSLSQKRTPEAIILSSTFTSIKTMAKRFLFPPPLIKDKFDNSRSLQKYNGPVLVLHGREDDLIPFRHAEKLEKDAGDAQLVPLPGGHNNISQYHRGGKAWNHIFLFLRENSLIHQPQHTIR